jgi:hypothetical protein
MWEEYRTSAFDIHSIGIIGLWFFAVFVAVPLWTLYICLSRLRLPPRTHMIQAAVYLLGWALVVGFVALDPYEFITWLKD